MDIRRRTMLAAGGAALAQAALSPAGAATAENPLAASIAPDGSSVKAIVVSTDGTETKFTPVDIPADNSPYPMFKQFLTHKARRVALYSAPAGHRAAIETAGKQFILLVAGEMTLAANGASRGCGAGEIILLDPGAFYHEQAGPAGYTAIKVALVD